MSRERPREVTVVHGIVAPFQGAWTLLVSPSLWGWAMIPVALFGLFATIAAWSATSVFARVRATAGRSFGAGSAGMAGAAVAGAVGVVAYIAVALVVALWVVPLFSAPFMDALAARVDRYQGREESLAVQVWRSLRVVLAGLFYVAIPQALLALVGFVVSPLAPVCFVVAAGLGALGLAYDSLDWPLSRRGLGVSARVAWMRAHAGPTFGLGLAVWAVSLVPGLVLLALPAIVVGAVRLVNDIEC